MGVWVAQYCEESRSTARRSVQKELTCSHCEFWMCSCRRTGSRARWAIVPVDMNLITGAQLILWVLNPQLVFQSFACSLHAYRRWLSHPRGHNPRWSGVHLRFRLLPQRRSDQAFWSVGGLRAHDTYLSLELPWTSQPPEPFLHRTHPSGLLLEILAVMEAASSAIQELSLLDLLALYVAPQKHHISMSDLFWTRECSSWDAGECSATSILDLHRLAVARRGTQERQNTTQVATGESTQRTQRWDPVRLADYFRPRDSAKHHIMQAMEDMIGITHSRIWTAAASRTPIANRFCHTRVGPETVVVAPTDSLGACTFTSWKLLHDFVDPQITITFKTVVVTPTDSLWTS